MKSWWEIETLPSGNTVRLIRAVAYYRHSAQDRQENSIPIQRDQVREWATKNGVEIIHEFADAGKSGLDAEGRPAFTEMMEEWVKKRKDFDYVLCLDVSRWGRFQDIDLSAQFSAEFRKHQKQIIYTTINKPHKSIAACFPDRACRERKVIKFLSRLHQKPLGDMQSMTLIRCERIPYAFERTPMKMIIANFASAAMACFLGTFEHADDTAITESAQATKPSLGYQTPAGFAARCAASGRPPASL